MPESYAERRINAKIAELNQAMFSLALEDPGKLALGHAKLLGKREGFQESIQEIRAAARSDIDPDDIPMGAPRLAA